MWTEYSSIATVWHGYASVVEFSYSNLNQHAPLTLFLIKTEAGLSIDNQLLGTIEKEYW